VLLIIEIALGIVLGFFLLRVIYATTHRQSSRPEREPEPTVWLVCIGGQTECLFDKEKGKGYCCTDMIYDPAFANTVHQFDTYEAAQNWAKEMVNVRLYDRWEPDTVYWHGNLEVREVTLPIAARWMEHRTADGKVDPAYLAECAAHAKMAEEKQTAEKAAHLARMQERRSRGNVKQ